MRIPLLVRDEWAQLAGNVKGWLRRAGRRVNVWSDEPTRRALAEAQRNNDELLEELKISGAADPVESIRSADAAGPDVPLQLLGSPAARRYAEAIRRAADACQEMEAERGIADGFSAELNSFAETAETEIALHAE